MCIIINWCYRFWSKFRVIIGVEISDTEDENPTDIQVKVNARTYKVVHALSGLNASGEWTKGQGWDLGFSRIAYRSRMAIDHLAVGRQMWQSSWNMSHTPFCLSRIAIVKICQMSRNHAELTEIIEVKLKYMVCELKF